MREVRGQKGFEGPSEQELEEYIKQSRKSLTQMQKGKPPVFFRPKKNRKKIVIGIVFILAIPTVFFSIATLMSNNASQSNFNNTTKPTTTQGTELLSETRTSIPETLDPEKISSNLEIILNEMISPNHSTIYPEITDGSINKSHLISDTDMMDLIWYLNQFESGSKWWNLGKELLFEKFPLWNKSYTEVEESELQIRALRSFLVYSPEEIPLEMYDLEIFHNSCTFLWEKILPKIDNSANTLASFPNNSIRLTNDQILFIEFLSKAIKFSNLFNQTLLSNYAKNMVETLDQLTNRTNGIPEFFDVNLSMSSSIFQCKHQGELILALNSLDIAYDLGSSVNLVISRLNKFITNYLINKDWSCSAYYNSSNRERSNEIFASDQSLIIQCNVLFGYLQSGKYIAGELIEKLKGPNSGFYFSSTKLDTQYLLDQIQILLALHNLILLESEIYPPTEKAAASWGFGAFLVIFSISLILLKKKLWGKKPTSCNSIE